MATLSLFYGILITMRPELGERHKKPHQHARHAGKQASFDIASGEELAGELDGDDEVKVRAWISIHREDLFANWTLLIEQGTFTKYEPPRLFDNRFENTLDNLAMNTQILLTDHTKNLQSPDVAMVVMLVNAGSDSPRLSVFPEDRVGLINADRFSPILLDKLLLREIWRTIGFTGGSGYAPYRGCVMQPAFNDNEIAGLMGDVLQPMTLQPFRKFEDRFKMKRTRMVPYELACEQGWAPAPTNAIQKAIWDKVHAAPKNPMKIEFDPKKGR